MTLKSAHQNSHAKLTKSNKVFRYKCHLWAPRSDSKASYSRLSTLMRRPDRIRLAHIDGSGFLRDENLKATVRIEESTAALNTLSPGIVQIALELPFYDNQYQISPTKDASLVRNQMKLLFPRSKKGSFIMAVPDPNDGHLCHRKTTELFVREFRKTYERPFYECSSKTALLSNTLDATR